MMSGYLNELFFILSQLHHRKQQYIAGLRHRTGFDWLFIPNEQMLKNSERLIEIVWAEIEKEDYKNSKPLLQDKWSYIKTFPKGYKKNWGSRS
jgi:hypothetical protein